jgi:hypothetical protein
MKLVLIVVIISLYYVESLKYASNHIVKNRINYKKSKIITLNVIDQVQDNTAILLQDNANAFVDGFERSFAGTMFSRLVGGIVGNIVAGIALTTITVALSKTVWNKDNKRNNEIENRNEIENDNKLKTKTIPIEAWGKLLICIAIDFLGDASYVIPGIGELEDVAWAPLSAFLLSKLFNNNALTTFEFVKEIIPGTDFIPVATISWLLEYVFAGTFISNSLQLSNKDSKK